MHTYCMLTLSVDYCKCSLYEKQVQSSHLQKKNRKQNFPNQQENVLKVTKIQQLIFSVCFFVLVSKAKKEIIIRFTII